MSIVIVRQDAAIDAWKEALTSYRKDLPVYSFLEPHPKDAITMALVWKHPVGSLEAYPNLKCIASSGAGVDFIWDDPITKNEVQITRVIDPMLANDMSEFVTGLIYNHLKGFNFYRNKQKEQLWQRISSKRISDVSVGILGLGQLGLHLGNSLMKQGFKVIGWSNSEKNLEGIESFVGTKELPLFLNKSSILVCLLPLTRTTKGILNTKLLLQLPKGAYLINVARGGHLVDADLIEALDNDHLSGAALDVFHKEPLPNDHPFWKHAKIQITPHIASVSDPKSVVPQIVDNYLRLQNKQPMTNVVSVKKGY